MILISAVGFGSYGVWSRFIGAKFGLFFQGWVRSGLVLLVLIPIALFTKSLRPINKKDAKWLLVPIIFGIFTQAPIYYAFNNMDIGTATLIFYASFLVATYLIGSIFIKEKMTRVKIISLFLGFLGLLFIFGLSLVKFSLIALVLAVINGVASGGEVSTTKKTSAKYSSLQLSIYIWGGIFVTHLPVSLLLKEPLVPLSLSGSWLSMFAFAGAGLVSFWLVVEGFKFVDASIGGLIGLMEVVFGVIFGMIIFGETLTISMLTGGLLILLAGMLPNLSDILSRRIKQ